MNLSSLKAVLGFTAVLSIAAPAAAGPTPAPAAPAPPFSSSLHMIITPGMTLTMDGDRVLAKATRRGLTSYHYDKGRLVRARYSNGQVATYHYADDKLERIEFSNGTVHTPVYVDGALAMIESSSGKKLGLAGGARGVDKVALMPMKKEGGGVRALRNGKSRDPALMNRTLVAIDSWESMKTEWECTIQPEGDTVCIGHPGQQPPSSGAHDGGWVPVDPGPGDGGMSNRPGEDGGNSSPGGSDRIPPNLPTQESCITAAKNTWEIMRDRFCPMVLDQAVCLRQNWQLFLDLRQECIAAFPLP